MNATPLLFAVTVMLCAVSFAAERDHHPSGLVRELADEGSPTREGEVQAFARFIDDNFAEYRPDFEWRPTTRFQDRTHVHQTYRLYYRGRRVSGRELKLHYNRKGWLEYANNGWEAPFEIDLPAE